jgi:HEPN domain-containing protein
MANDYNTWMDRAKSSLAISKTRYDENVFYEDLCFQAQQAVEKALKAFLIFYKVDPEKTHNLVALIKEYKDAIIIAEKCIKWIEKKITELLKRAEEEKNQQYFDIFEKK